MRPLTIHDLRLMKEKKEPITMVTAYDYPTAKLVEEAGLDMILVGDSLGMVVLGYDSTIPVTLQDMIHHTKAVTRGVNRVFVVADMPFLTYHQSIDKTIENAGRLIQEAGAKAVKMEGGKELAPTISTLIKAGIPVMGHIGLTPQAVHQLGGYKVQGKTLSEAHRLLADAKALEEAGVFALVLEAIPGELGSWISKQLSIPTIGIGAGNECDGQVLVFHDLVQYASNLSPKFVKPYGDIGKMIKDSLLQYKLEVKQRIFPAKEHTFTMKEEQLDKLYGKV